MAHARTAVLPTTLPICTAPMHNPSPFSTQTFQRPFSNENSNRNVCTKLRVRSFPFSANEPAMPYMEATPDPSVAPNPCTPAQPPRSDADRSVDNEWPPRRHTVNGYADHRQHSWNRHTQGVLHSLDRLSRQLSFDQLDDDAAAERIKRIEQAKLLDSELYREVQQSALSQALHFMSETFLMARLALTLWSYLGLGWRWSLHLLQLVAYATLLMPGFAQMVVFYFFSSRVVRSIPYGTKARNRLDLYLPPDHWRQADAGLKPVVVFVTGGAWTIGYKAWGSLLGRRLSKAGCLVACLDYRNFPQGTVTEMLEDVNTGIRWVLHRIRYYGGDPSRVFVVGQSCGAQLASLAITIQAEQELLGKQLPGGAPSWSARDLQGFIGVSGVYNVHDIADYLHSRGLYRTLFERIQSLNGKTALKLLSPTYCVLDIGVDYGKYLPPVTLLHGSDDRCVPVKYAEQFKEVLKSIGARVHLKTYVGETHTSPLIENPLRGGRDELQDDVLSTVLGKQVRTNHMGMCPRLLIWAASLVNPF